MGGEQVAQDALEASRQLNAQRDLIVAGVVATLEPKIRADVANVLRDEMADQVAEGLVRGLKLLLKEDQDAAPGEPTLVKSFWSTGYRELTQVASTSATQWVGKKMLLALVTGIFLWSVAFLVKHGALKWPGGS